MSTIDWLKYLHRTIAVAIVFIVPLLIYLKNGVFEPWTFVLGAVLGFGWWYFKSLFPW